MRIAIFGSGGAGGYFGARLARAGEDVVFIARGEHAAAIRAHGLHVDTPAGEIVIEPAQVHDDPARVGAVDVVIVGVKTWQLPDAERALRPMLGAGTFVVPLLNGVEAASQLADAIGPERVLGGLCGTISWVDAPGRIRNIGGSNFVKFGELDGRASERVMALRRAFERAGVTVETPVDIVAAVWEKFAFVVPFGGVGAVTRAPVGVTRATPGTRRMLEQGTREIIAVGRARGVNLSDGLVARAMASIDSLVPGATASLQRDVVAGRPSELDAWNGAVVRLGRDARVPTPLHDFIYESLLPLERHARRELEFPE